MTVAELLAAGVFGGPALGEALEAADGDDVADVCALAAHASAEVHAAVARELPIMLGGRRPSPTQIATVIALTRDADTEVRDWACFALGVQWREVDTPQVRDALAEHLDDEDTDTRCEALVGLAYRHDPRALPAVREALSRPSGELYLLELEAAGALSDPSLHELVLRHLHGWGEGDRLQVEAIRRLTNPAGIGSDLIEEVADLYRRRARGHDVEDVLPAWHQMNAALEINPRLAPRLLDQVANLLGDDPEALRELCCNSALSQLTDDLVDDPQ